ncbi:alkylmercury lyase-like protein [Kribbella sp. VKM Ac-2527]|uniref:Alkylmercury lyase-like protein n=1 Tax=Kribbella caucasensis TaxID=2512215 RepID=A0A4R6K9P1_9ACTN|nr:alkylmercury lyase family protein [Kribbella sp. VKM Ac-2527]TDO44719.1 alkylmercury lyase-like protein [Kribbella sp. VKM Ac-2527]
MKLEVLHIPDCPNLPPLLERLAAATDLPITTRVIDSDNAATEFGMAGSPTLLINGVDPFAADDGDCGVACRLYRDQDGRIVPAPSIEQLRKAITAAGQHAGEQHAAGQSAVPGEVLSAWRTRALPMDPVEKAAHQAILRTFAATGRPPTLDAVDRISNVRTSGDVLTALHDLDAIRLDRDGQIAVAYPFSATPTRHRVRIGDGQAGDGVDVYAMCAIDALGVSAMVGEDTLIESVDVTTGRRVIVTTTAGRTTWEPKTAVVFIGADAGGGPSADCCCDYLNFFADRAAAQAWTGAHPNIPGQILDQDQAEDLAIRLFGHLLATT